MQQAIYRNSVYSDPQLQNWVRAVDEYTEGSTLIQRTLQDAKGNEYGVMVEAIASILPGYSYLELNAPDSINQKAIKTELIAAGISDRPITCPWELASARALADSLINGTANSLFE